MSRWGQFAIVALSVAATWMSLLAYVPPARAQDIPVLKQVSAIDLPGPGGKRFDYLVIDYDDGWLFSTHWRPIRPMSSTSTATKS